MAQWSSQRVPPMGAIRAEGIKNQLGRPDMDPTVLLIREAAQNSWDAADPYYDGPVRFAVDLRSLGESARRLWRKALTADAPSADHLPLREALDLSSANVLFISDRGTTGLGGPTRADEDIAGAGHDYVSFVLNVGDPRDTDFGGGTYGFGKAVFYLASQASSIIVYTRCRDEGGAPESRLVGCALGASYTLGNWEYTGRHWYGHPISPTGVVEPLRNKEADDLARQLGFPTFEGDDLGTCIAVVAPNLRDDTPEQYVERIRLAILWHLWPKMLHGKTLPSMAFNVAYNGISHEVPTPEDHPIISRFADCLTDLRAHGENVLHNRSLVGRILLRAVYAPQPVIDDVGRDAGLEDAVCHCCLLRTPELVVEYRKGPPLTVQSAWYAGVFKVNEGFDDVFALSEPPTHDAWSPQQLEGPGRNVVRGTMRKIDELLRAKAAPVFVDQTAESGEGFAGMSGFLGRLLAPAPGGGAGTKAPKVGGGGGSAAKVRLKGAARWDEYEGRDVLIQSFEATTSVTVEAETSVQVWGGGSREVEPPLGATVPVLVGWRDAAGRIFPPGPLAVDSREGKQWEAIIVAPPDAVIRIRIREAVFDSSVETGDGDG